jgi:hypothetical protein
MNRLARQRALLCEPAHFRLGLAVPVELNFPDLVGKSPRDFTRAMGNRLREQLVQRAARLVELARDVLGTGAVSLLRTSDDLPRLFEGNPEVITIIGHSPNARELELLDERSSLAELLASIPEEFVGFLELRICNGEPSVADEVRRLRPHCTVRATEGTLDFAQVAWSYARALRFVVAGSVPYDVATRRAHAELIAMTRRGSEI